MKFLLTGLMFISCASWGQTTTSKNKPGMNAIQLIILDPGHFHAALVQKYRYAGVSDTVRVYAPAGKELDDYLALTNKFNSRATDPTAWKEIVYSGADYLEKMITEKAGNVVVIAGNNSLKSTYIQRTLRAGFHVLADKPMAIYYPGFLSLQKDFGYAGKNGLLLYDIMTERYSGINILQRILMNVQDVFGTVKKGSDSLPAISIKSIHHFYKEVSGSPLIRPAWFFDIRQQGEGITDISTHLIDIVQWLCFPGQVLEYKKDIHVVTAHRWATAIDPGNFRKVTGLDQYPGFLSGAVKDNVLQVYSNGSIEYSIKGVHVKMEEQWAFEAPQGAGDQFYSSVAGTRATLVVEQGPDQHFVPELYIVPIVSSGLEKWENDLKSAFATIQTAYPGVLLEKQNNKWHVVIPPLYRTDHESQFAMVTKQFFTYLGARKLPEWEKSYMLAKYYTTLEALKKAH